MSALAFAAVSVLPLLVVVAALKDVTSMTIPNWLSGALALAFVPAALLTGLPWQEGLMHLGVGAAMLALGAGLFALGWLGGGDAKLLAGCALWLGWPDTLTLVLWTAVGGGVVAVSFLAVRKVAAHGLVVSGPAWLTRLLTPGGDVPYGLAIAVGALAAFPGSELLTRAAAL